MAAKDKDVIKQQKREIQHLKDSVENLEGRLGQCETADKESADHTKRLETDNAELKAEVGELETQVVEKDKTLANVAVQNNQNLARIESQAKEIQDLTAKHNEALAKLKTVEDKLNSKVRVVVIGLLLWI